MWWYTLTLCNSLSSGYSQQRPTTTKSSVTKRWFIQVECVYVYVSVMMFLTTLFFILPLSLCSAIFFPIGLSSLKPTLLKLQSCVLQNIASVGVRVFNRYLTHWPSVHSSNSKIKSTPYDIENVCHGFPMNAIFSTANRHGFF